MSYRQAIASKLPPKSFKDGREFSKGQLITFVLVFAVIGGFVLFRSFAAGPVVASVQVEKMMLPTGASVIQDSTASAGQAVKVTNNSTLRGSVVIPNTSNSFSVVARGSNCYGGWPWVKVTLDGKAVMPGTKIGSTAWKSYTVKGNVGTGAHSITVSASNNGRVNRGCSRHLDLDLITFYGTTAPPANIPTVAISATPASITAGSASTLTWSSTNATACTANGSWSGTQTTSGTTSTGALNANANYSLTCTGPGGSATSNAAVTVSPLTSPPPTIPPTIPPNPPPTIPPVIPPPPPPTSGGQTVGVPYTCTGPVNNLHIVGTGSDSIALVNLKSGCTGSLSFDITITSAGGDGVKVQGGAHDLNIGPSTLVCSPGVPSSFHQDGVQVQGGSNVIFHGLKVVCPDVTGNGAGGFYIDGKDFSGISNVICDGCNLEHTHGGVTYNDGGGHTIPVNSGARNSILHYNPTWKDYAHIYQGSSGAGFLNQNNTNAPACTTLANC